MTYTIKQGDALELMKELPDKSVDAVITDPPYGVSLELGSLAGSRWKGNIENDGAGWLFLPFEEIWRVLKPSGVLFTFMSQRAILKDPRFKDYLVWVKNNVIYTYCTKPNKFGFSYELIGYAPKPDFEIRGPRPRNVLTVPNINGEDRLHPTEKPLALIERLMSLSTDEDMTVLDPFMGSGTTGVAALQLGRNFIGYELDKKYFKIAEKRIKSEALQTKFPMMAQFMEVSQ